MAIGGLHSDAEYLAAIEAHDREAKERYRLYRIERFLGAYAITAAGFTFAQADELERKGADYHLAEQLAGTASCPPELAMKILL